MLNATRRTTLVLHFGLCGAMLLLLLMGTAAPLAAQGGDVGPEFSAATQAAGRIHPLPPAGTGGQTPPMVSGSHQPQPAMILAQSDEQAKEKLRLEQQRRMDEQRRQMEDQKVGRQQQAPRQAPRPADQMQKRGAPPGGPARSGTGKVGGTTIRDRESGSPESD